MTGIAIIGGGVAGAATAIHLSRLGHPVTLFERESAPHPKVCGEFLSPEALVFLDNLGISLDQAGAVSYKRFQLHSPRRSLETLFPFSARGLSRHSLDSLLLQEAEKSGASVLRGANVSHFEWNPASRTFFIKTGTQTHSSQVLFLATGKHPLKNLHPRSGLESKNIGYKMLFRLSPQNTEKLSEIMELFSFPQGYAGLSLVENGQANLCFIVRQALVRKTGGSFENILEHLKSHHKALSHYLRDAVPAWKQPLVISGIPYGFLKSPSPQDVSAGPLYCLGDQLAVIPSFTGTGIALALWSARKASLAFQRGESPRLYHASCRAELQSRMRFCFHLHCLLQIPWLADLGVTLLKSIPSLLQTLLHKTRAPMA